MNRPAHIVSSQAFTGFTATEFLRVVESGALADVRVELVGGEIVKMVPAYLAHGEANMLLGARLLPLYAGRGRVAVDLMIAVAPDTIRAADLAVVRDTAPRDRPVAADDLILVAEVAASTLAEDLGPKLADYATAGLAHYWVVDLEGGVVYVMAGPDDGRYRDRWVVPFGEPLPVPGTDGSVAIG